VFAGLDVALEKVGDVVEALLRVQFLSEAFSLTEKVNEGPARSWLAEKRDSRPTIASTSRRRLPGCEMVRVNPHDTNWLI